MNSTLILPSPPAPPAAAPSQPAPSVALGSFWGLLTRDLRVLFHNLGQAIGQTVTQPLLRPPGGHLSPF